MLQRVFVGQELVGEGGLYTPARADGSHGISGVCENLVTSKGKGEMNERFPFWW
jgi:hypothetical protein